MSGSSKKLLQAAAGNAGGDPLYVEDVFSTYLYAGNDAYQTITNGIDLLNEGGLVWVKSRTTTGRDNYLWDTERGYTSGDTNFTGHTLISNSTSAAGNGEHVRNIYEDGYQSWGGYHVNMTGQDYVSWSFRKAEKFFDVVTWTGNGDGTDRYYNHNLNSVPNCVIVKRTDAAMDWGVYHSQLGTGGGSGLKLNTTDAIDSPNPIRITPSSTQIKIRGDSGEYNENNATYVAYLFASDAGGFGDDGDENIIKCGSYTGNGSTTGPTIDCGFEPQWLIVKGTGDSDWIMLDVMRGIPTGGNDARLKPNSPGAETSTIAFCDVTATGFHITTTNSNVNTNGTSYIYMAIRRPMKTPESGTEVFHPNYVTTTSPENYVMNPSFAPDLAFEAKTSSSGSTYWGSRLQGNGKYLKSFSDDAEASYAPSWSFDAPTGSFLQGIFGGTSSQTMVNYLLKRATGFMDVVAYTGNSAVSTVDNKAHNLGVVPELIIFGRRSGADDRQVYHSALDETKVLYLNTTVWALSSPYMNNTAPTSSVFTANGGYLNSDGVTYIAYLFATLAGVSKVGSYTGTGATLNVGCGFTAGARFILIKRTDNPAGDWYTYNSARGIVAGNDPYLLINSTAAEVTNTDYIDPLNAGFTVTSSAPDALNADGGDYIFLAIA